MHMSRTSKSATTIFVLSPLNSGVESHFWTGCPPLAVPHQTMHIAPVGTASQQVDALAAHISRRQSPQIKQAHQRDSVSCSVCSSPWLEGPAVPPLPPRAFVPVSTSRPITD